MLVCKHFVFVGVGKKSAYLQLFPIIEEKRHISCKLCKKFKIFSSSAILISFVSNICCTHPICSTEHSIKCLPHIFRRTTNIHLNRSHKIPGLRTSANWFVINILTYWTCKCTDIKPNKHWFVQPQSHLWSHFLSVNSLKKTTNWKKRRMWSLFLRQPLQCVHDKNTNILLWQPNLSLCSRVNTCIQKFPFKLIDLI